MAQRGTTAGSGKYADRIKEARKAAGLNQQQLAEALGLSRNTVAGWETGHSRPDLDSLPALCKALGLSLGGFFGAREGVTRGERQLLTAFRSLEAEDQQAILWQVEALAAGRAAKRKEKQEQEERHLQHLQLLRGQVVALYRSNLFAAAGTGFPLEGEQGEAVWLWKDESTEKANEIVTVNGHSMEPTFDHGDQVLVQHTDRLREGEIGLFLVDGEGYIKEYRADGLYSHNSDYAPLRFSENSDVRLVGRVLGKVKAEQRLTEEEKRWLEESK
ncbi:MAG: LexA family transcriptional regulator [Clostridia bacterium]|nr:LexA family transcriptional regulator [Clostridia bacterium]